MTINGMLQTTPALDLAVNSASERGLLGIALHPRFPRNPRVYLYWTESTAMDAAGAPVDTTDLASTHRFSAIASIDDPTESETLQFGAGFGVGTDIQTGPNGNLFVVSLNNGAIYEIHRVH
jgi:glucose/arabinose dehydrogenase